MEHLVDRARYGSARAKSFCCSCFNSLCPCLVVSADSTLFFLADMWPEWSPFLWLKWKANGSRLSSSSSSSPRSHHQCPLVFCLRVATKGKIFSGHVRKPPTFLSPALIPEKMVCVVMGAGVSLGNWGNVWPEESQCCYGVIIITAPSSKTVGSLRASSEEKHRG